MVSPEERFAVLFESTHQSLLAYAIRRVADPADAADVVADTFLVAWRRLDDVPPGDQARPWLFGVARKVLANLHRGEHRRDALAERLRAALSEVVEPAALGVPAVELALNRLGDDDKEILRLVAWDELAREEIAAVLGVSRATVRVRLHRARRRLLTQLEAPPDEDPDAGGPAAKRTPRTGHVVSGRASARPAVEEVR